MAFRFPTASPRRRIGSIIATLALTAALPAGAGFIGSSGVAAAQPAPINASLPTFNDLAQQGLTPQPSAILPALPELAKSITPNVLKPAIPNADNPSPFPGISRGKSMSEEYDEGSRHPDYPWWNEWGFDPFIHTCAEDTSDDGIISQNCRIERDPADYNEGNEDNSILEQYSRKAPAYTDIVKTKEPYDCAGSIVSERVKEIDRKYGFVETLRCYGTVPEVFPTSIDDLVGASFIYPRDIETAPADKKFPVVLLGPGFTAESGMQDGLATMLAQHGFIAVPSYSTVNALGEQYLAGMIVADKANNNPHHPLHGRMDFSRTYLGGHSASAGAALGMNGILELELGHLIPELKVKGVAAANPSTGDLSWHGITGNAPTLFIEADHEAVVPFGWSHSRYKSLNQPAWWVPVRDSWHNTSIDATYNSSEAGLMLAFLLYLEGDRDAAQWFEGPNWKLPHDRALYDVQRNTAANQLS